MINITAFVRAWYAKPFVSICNKKQLQMKRAQPCYWVNSMMTFNKKTNEVRIKVI
ncbi:hypothetical protein GCM10009443_32060 [Mucilaginibacter ginsenosidivorans]